MHPYGSSAYRSAPSASEVSARRYRYTGKERDEETGLDYFGARYYAPWLGRWTTADPLGIGADGPGLYNYVRGSPVVLRDPNGTVGMSDYADDRTQGRPMAPRPSGMAVLRQLGRLVEGGVNSWSRFAVQGATGAAMLNAPIGLDKKHVVEGIEGTQRLEEAATFEGITPAEELIGGAILSAVTGRIFGSSSAGGGASNVIDDVGSALSKSARPLLQKLGQAASKVAEKVPRPMGPALQPAGGPSLPGPTWGEMGADPLERQ